jgi:hypothetical protein
MRSTWVSSLAWLLVILPLTAVAAPPPAPVPRPNLLLIVLDTLRYDATSLGDSPGNSTPFLASLQSRGVVFTHAYSTHDFTPPSHFSVLTGLQDGLGGNDDHAENGVPFQLEGAGYSTFGTVANGLLSPKIMSVLQPIESFNEVLEVPGGGATAEDNINATLDIQQRLALFQCQRTPHNISVLFYSAGRMLPLFFDQIRAAKPPYFGFVNVIDSHEPYVPDPQKYKPETALPPGFSGDVLHRRVGSELTDPTTIADPKRRFYVQDKIRVAGMPQTVTIDLSPEALTIYHNRYRAKVRELDLQLNEFFKWMEDQGTLDNTIVVITSDHGESFGEADLITHNFHDRGDYESTHHVPLLIVLPPRYRVATRRVDEKVSIADVAPTLYDLAGLDWSPFKRVFGAGYGRSLVPLFTSVPPRVMRASAPIRQPRDHTQEEQERLAAMRSLGYLAQ